MTTIPKIGDTHIFGHLKGYIVHQNRPYKCYHGCVCGKCNGESWETTEAIADVIYWADNSIEIVGTNGSRETLVAPHGDCC